MKSFYDAIKFQDNDRHMTLLNSDALLDLLSERGLITPKQRQFITLEKGKQRQKLLKKFASERKFDKNFPDLVDVIVSFRLNRGGKKGQILDEETIIQAVSKSCNIPFKKLDPLKLDMDTVTKTIPKNFAIGHLLLPSISRTVFWRSLSMILITLRC